MENMKQGGLKLSLAMTMEIHIHEEDIGEVVKDR
jgi:hypothetical protein